eukprot:scaffold27168_cov59-Phaeocystis_antarctica.AAC.2
MRAVGIDELVEDHLRLFHGRSDGGVLHEGDKVKVGGLGQEPLWQSTRCTHDQPIRRRAACSRVRMGITHAALRAAPRGTAPTRLGEIGTGLAGTCPWGSSRARRQRSRSCASAARRNRSPTSTEEAPAALPSLGRLHPAASGRGGRLEIRLAAPAGSTPPGAAPWTRTGLPRSRSVARPRALCLERVASRKAGENSGGEYTLGPCNSQHVPTF